MSNNARIQVWKWVPLFGCFGYWCKVSDTIRNSEVVAETLLFFHVELLEQGVEYCSMRVNYMETRR